MDLGLSYTAHVFLYIEYIAFEHLKKSELTQCLKYQYIKLWLLTPALMWLKHHVGASTL